MHMVHSVSMVAGRKAVEEFLPAYRQQVRHL